MNKTKDFQVKQIVDGIYEIETRYLGREKYAACYLVEDAGEVAIIETNTNYAVPRILAALEHLGLEKKQVKYVILTHIHLDHAGGTGELMRQLPHPQLVVHPRGKKHMIEPEKLIASVKEVYGEHQYQKLYGEILPIPKDRVLTGEDGDILHLGTRDLLLLHMDGHAKHHFIIHDKKSNTIFSGDNFGIGYPKMIFNDSRLLFPSTSPTQFEPENALLTYQRIVDLAPSCILLTHYGCLEDINDGFAQLVQWITFSKERGSFHYNQGHRDQVLIDKLRLDLWAELEKEVTKRRGSGLTPDEKELLQLDTDLNAQGIAYYIAKLNTK